MKALFILVILMLLPVSMRAQEYDCLSFSDCLYQKDRADSLEGENERLQILVDMFTRQTPIIKPETGEPPINFTPGHGVKQRPLGFWYYKADSLQSVVDSLTNEFEIETARKEYWIFMHNYKDSLLTNYLDFIDSIVGRHQTDKPRGE